MADHSPAEPSLAAAANKIMSEGGTQGGGGDPDGAPGDSESAAAQETQTPVENTPKPKSDFMQSLPNSVKCRVLALKKLQKQCDQIETKFQKEFHALERKYSELYKPLLAKIQELKSEIKGCAWTLEGEEQDEEEDEDAEEQVEVQGAAAAAPDYDPHAEVPDDAEK
ncbi:nucleosome assembly protein 1-like 5 [Lepus europaeus]|uniref:nucleosome assembly protein 1-like 5 n=1 Tax=Lepus europaeus TaxID=9983 RepID=UPI002B46221B|nr:nucleosome assembly protein 1-like 5 [Lepus europaeus]